MPSKNSIGNKILSINGHIKIKLVIKNTKNLKNLDSLDTLTPNW